MVRNEEEACAWDLVEPILEDHIPQGVEVDLEVVFRKASQCSLIGVVRERMPDSSWVPE